MDRKIEVAFDEEELCILWTVMDMRCQRLTDGKRTALRDKLANSLERIRSIPVAQPKRDKTFPICGGPGEYFTADLDWCPACHNQW